MYCLAYYDGTQHEPVIVNPIMSTKFPEYIRFRPYAIPNRSVDNMRWVVAEHNRPSSNLVLGKVPRCRKIRQTVVQANFGVPYRIERDC